ncbi:T9SS type A sorting domain-containing protein [Hymenobacter sp. ASUV-10]|uniref:T9SS type A sorting domain-containing protein n=1 Tax=Hymenobacter aranciens TaxID=3063996 RepID=A0ABT9B9K9_9BACT|nr:T9SS type A sorting domain-containing protein [Hymenobacter sp. ASUV-10]MDO7874956.1 T9SS type A sorting domain-containing protein [Hymenobacter sp. ASUV-10]
MKKAITLALVSTLAGAASAQAQITLDGIIDANELGTTGGKYTSLGAFTTAHAGGVGFGNAGLLHMYGANSSTKLYIGLAGTLEASGNNFQLYLDLPNRSGVPVGTGLPAIAGTTTLFGTFTGGGIGGTKLELEADAAIAVTGTNDVQAAIYTATTGVAKTLGDGVSSPSTPDGVANTLPGSTTTGAYSIFAGTRLAYLAPTTPTGDITSNPGNTNGGGAGSYGLEYEFDRAAMGLPSGASVVHAMAAYVSGDGYWSSDVIPEIPGNGNNNLGFSPDFTVLAGNQNATLSVVVTSTRQAEDAVVAMSVFPNPAQGQSTVSYRVLDRQQPVLVTVTDLVGRPVKTLLNQSQNVGFHDLKVAAGTLAAGIYQVNVRVGDKSATRKLVVAE